MGSVIAICTIDTISGSRLRLVISQLDPVSNMASPMVDAALATRMTLKAALANMPHRDFGATAFGAA